MHLQLPQLHPTQRLVGRNSRRFSALRCGRRWGKTTYGLVRCNVVDKGIFNGYPVGWFAPTYKYLADVWRDALAMLHPLIISKDKQEKRINLATGGVLDFWTLDDPDAGRGRKYGHVVIDEAAKVRNLRDAWEQSIRPTLSDLEGSADFLSTPKGGDYFAELCEKAKTDPDTWASFHMPTSLNPHIKPAEIEAARLDLPELVFAQEYLAHFVDFGGTAVKREWLKYGDIFARFDRSLCRIALGVDLAISMKESAAFTAFVVVAIDPLGNVYVLWAERARLTFHATMQRVEQLAAAWLPQVIVVEEVAYQAAVVQELLRTTSLNVVGKKPEKDKLTRFQPLQNRYERGLVYHSDELPAVFEGELLAFPNDEVTCDLVDAFVYAWMGAAQYDPAETVEGAGARISVGAASIATDDGTFGTVRVQPSPGF